ncbi:MAG TPA: hypothetical protein VIM61_10590 [Chthoniobacterales bacterium]
MHYEDVYADEEFEEKFTEALADAAALLPKFYSVAAAGPATFRDLAERVTRFSFPGAVAEKDGQPHEGFVFGELEIDLGADGYSLAIPELNFQESQATFG